MQKELLGAIGRRIKTRRAKGLSMRPRHLALLGALALQTCGTLMPVPAVEYPAPNMSEWYSSLMIPDSMPVLCQEPTSTGLFDHLVGAGE